ncbi:amidohydrolase family protein (plasmid) [Agrobacterium leguminum]|uniref:2,3-dihydroxybenzoate decarboxylase n=1 Tax=Agrobacterium deltaense NCPPB 1641 TaxID=1183425 RepID=A0A1S7UBA1_9HYPH|nr:MULTISPECIES: amidohydrolase family protein [Agrobacterium]WFS69767.1 amidohydrolase family protein [Agrobacterium leguminum]CVI64079.1 2,3-dihydroxybenzoate decarboxylase [Agrobacterium deltaense NCPPB 1641]
MLGKIGLEEHFAIEETVMDSAGFVPENYWVELKARLLDIQERRVREMDENGMEMMILSLNAPAVQAIPDRKRALEIAKRSNDYLAEQVARRPDRFQGLAALPLQDTDDASRELERSVKELGFKGALVNGFSQNETAGTTLYYDLPQYRSFWSTVQDLDVPFYLHPRNPLPEHAQIYEGHPWLLGPTWAFAQETAVHALRLMASGVFDDFPRLKIILGHLGEGLPYSIWRCDYRNAWVQTPPRYPAKRRLGEYFRENFYLTTSGNFRTQTLIDALLEIGSDRILFSTDWPFENVNHAAEWFDVTSIAEGDRVKIGRENAIKLFKLDI